jgi:hypothetical protein
VVWGSVRFLIQVAKTYCLFTGHSSHQDAGSR